MQDLLVVNLKHTRTHRYSRGALTRYSCMNTWLHRLLNCKIGWLVWCVIQCIHHSGCCRLDM